MWSVEVKSYCTFGCGAIIWCNLRTLLLLRDSPRDKHYACDLVHKGKATHACLAGLAIEKSRGTITLTCDPKIARRNRFPP